MVSKTSILKVQGIDIAMTIVNENDFISLTDMIKAKDGDFLLVIGYVIEIHWNIFLPGRV